MSTEVKTTETTQVPETQTEVQKVTLVASDGTEFEVTKTQAELSGTLKEMLGGMADFAEGATDKIPLSNLDSKTLGAIVEYMKLKTSPENPDDVQTNCEKNVLDKLREEHGDKAILDLLLATDFLDC